MISWLWRRVVGWLRGLSRRSAANRGGAASLLRRRRGMSCGTTGGMTGMLSVSLESVAGRGQGQRYQRDEERTFHLLHNTLSTIDTWKCLHSLQFWYEPQSL